MLPTYYCAYCGFAPQRVPFPLCGEPQYSIPRGVISICIWEKWLPVRLLRLLSRRNLAHVRKKGSALNSDQPCEGGLPRPWQKHLYCTGNLRPGYYGIHGYYARVHGTISFYFFSLLSLAAVRIDFDVSLGSKLSVALPPRQGLMRRYF